MEGASSTDAYFSPRRRTPQNNSGLDCPLLYRAANLREHIVGIRPDETNRAHDNDKNYRLHDRVFGDVLATLIVPELL